MVLAVSDSMFPELLKPDRLTRGHSQNMRPQGRQSPHLTLNTELADRTSWHKQMYAEEINALETED